MQSSSLQDKFMIAVRKLVGRMERVLGRIQAAGLTPAAQVMMNLLFAWVLST